jgi:hypothetical protein
MAAMADRRIPFGRRLTIHGTGSVS